jgi:hypothetical protein
MTARAILGQLRDTRLRYVLSVPGVLTLYLYSVSTSLLDQYRYKQPGHIGHLERLRRWRTYRLDVIIPTI